MLKKVQGTELYLAPELYDEELRVYDSLKADTYALGQVLLRMLTKKFSKVAH